MEWVQHIKKYTLVRNQDQKEAELWGLGWKWVVRTTFQRCNQLPWVWKTGYLRPKEHCSLLASGSFFICFREILGKGSREVPLLGYASPTTQRQFSSPANHGLVGTSMQTNLDHPVGQWKLRLPLSCKPHSWYQGHQAPPSMGHDTLGLSLALWSTCEMWWRCGNLWGGHDRRSYQKYSDNRIVRDLWAGPQW